MSASLSPVGQQCCIVLAPSSDMRVQLTQLPGAAVQDVVQAKAEPSSHTAGFSDWHKVCT